MNTLAGHIFVRDAIRLDYCVIEAINSMLPICDFVVVYDCSSTDGTDELLCREFGLNDKVKLYFDQQWDVAVGGGGARLRLLAEICRKKTCELGATWQLMIQADEVLHERSYPAITKAISSFKSDRYTCRRVDLYGDVDHCICTDIRVYPPNKQPMQPNLVRLAKSDVEVVGDAGELDPRGAFTGFMEEITIYHYSMVRDGLKLNNKILEMHEWYHNQKPDPTSPIVKWQQEGKPFDNEPWYRLKGELWTIPYPHPSAAIQWVKEHEHVGKV